MTVTYTPKLSTRRKLTLHWVQSTCDIYILCTFCTAVKNQPGNTRCTSCNFGVYLAYTFYTKHDIYLPSMCGPENLPLSPRCLFSYELHVFFYFFFTFWRFWNVVFYEIRLFCAYATSKLAKAIHAFIIAMQEREAWFYIGFLERYFKVF